MGYNTALGYTTPPPSPSNTKIKELERTIQYLKDELSDVYKRLDNLESQNKKSSKPSTCIKVK